MHVFAEKPFCLTVAQGEELVKLAAAKKVVNQIGYHNKFVGTFQEVKKIVNSGALGNIYHFIGEAYGPVVTNKKQDTWVPTSRKVADVCSIMHLMLLT